MKPQALKKSLLDYAIKGSLTSRFRRENAGLDSHKEIESYNETIRQKRKDLEKELKILESQLKKVGKKDTSPTAQNAESTKEIKQNLKAQIANIKKEITKCKEITPLFNQPHEVPPLKALSGGWGVKGGIRGATSRATQQTHTCKFKPPCPPLKEKADNTESTEQSTPFEIPESWAWVRLGDICEIVSGTSYGKDDLSDKGIRILRGGNINKNNHNVDLFANDVIVKETLFNKEKSIHKGDILITGTNDISNIAKCAFSTNELKNTQIGAFLRIIRISKEQNAKYIFYIIATSFYEKYIQSCVSGTVSSLLNIKNEYIENFTIPLPPLEEQKAIVEKLDLLVTLANEYESIKEELKRIEKRIEKSLLKIALEGILSKGYRRSKPSLSAHTEIKTYNTQILQKRKDLEKELKILESQLKKPSVIASEQSERGNPYTQSTKEIKQNLKAQIANIKKEITKCKEITPLFNQPHEVPPLKALSGGWGVKGGIRGATSRAAQQTHTCKFKPPCPPLKEKADNTESTRDFSFATQTQNDKIPFAIPESWAWVRLGDICEIVRGGSPRPIEKYLTDSSGFNWIKISDSDMGGKYINKTKQKIIESGLNQTRFVKSGSLLLTNSMSFGRPYILNIDGCIHDGWLVLSDFDNLATIDYLYFILSSGYANKCFQQLAAGGVVKNLTTDKVKEQIIPLPPLEEQEYIVNVLDSLFALTKGLRVE